MVPAHWESLKNLQAENWQRWRKSLEAEDGEVWYGPNAFHVLPLSTWTRNPFWERHLQLPGEPRAEQQNQIIHRLSVPRSPNLTLNQSKRPTLFSSKAHRGSYHSNHRFITSYPIKWLTVCFIAALYYFFNGKAVVAHIPWHWPPITAGLFYSSENVLNKNICWKEKRMCHWVAALLLFTSQTRGHRSRMRSTKPGPPSSEFIAAALIKIHGRN